MPSTIEWTDESWNPIKARNRETGGVGHFCVHHSPGCKFCYAERLQKWPFNNPIRYAAQDIHKVEPFLNVNTLKEPFHWKKPRTVFVCSMTDLFYEGWPLQWKLDIFDVMKNCPQHTFQVLTKRASEMQEFITTAMRMGGATVLPNVWFGVSVENQKWADERIPYLLDTPAAVRFLSVEPLLGPVALTGLTPQYEKRIHWVIVGGESGRYARGMHPDWARGIRDQCIRGNTPFFFKQWGEWGWTDVNGVEVPYQVGKNAAGRELDGRTWDEYPEPKEEV